MVMPRTDVVQVLLSPRIGGAESLAATLQTEWRAMGLSAETVYLDLAAAARPPWQRILHLRRALQRLRPSALLAHSALPNVYARLVAPPRIATCVVMHGGDDFADSKLRLAERVLRLRTTAVVAVNEKQRRGYRARFGTAVPVERIPNAVSTQMRPAGVVRSHPRLAATVARVVPQKQPEFWAEVGAAAREALPDLRFEWWGPLGDDPEVGRAAALAGTSGNTALRGSTSDPHAVYAEADLLFHPARAEAQSIGLLEAAASGLPIVCSEPVAATLDERVPRFTYGIGDVHGAVAALQRVRDDWPRPAERARAVAGTIREEYSPRACAERYLAVLGLEGADRG